MIEAIDEIPASLRRLAFGATALIALAASGAPAHAQLRPGTALLPPVTPACISSPFGPRILPNRPLAGTFHPGIDLPAPEGAPVHAIAPGTVIRVQRHGPGGLEMLIQHDGFVAVYSHLGHIAPVVAGGHLTVYGGETIATIGRTGVTYGMHLYLGILLNGRPVDPAPMLSLAPCGGSGAGSVTHTTNDGRIMPTRLYAGS